MLHSRPTMCLCLSPSKLQTLHALHYKLDVRAGKLHREPLCPADKMSVFGIINNVGKHLISHTIPYHTGESYYHGSVHHRTIYVSWFPLSWPVLIWFYFIISTFQFQESLTFLKLKFWCLNNNFAVVRYHWLILCETAPSLTINVTNTNMAIVVEQKKILKDVKITKSLAVLAAAATWKECWSVL